LRLPIFAVFADAQIMTVLVRITNRRKYHSTFILDLRHTAIVMLQQRPDTHTDKHLSARLRWVLLMLHGKIIKVFAGFKGPTSNGKEGTRRERRNEGKEGLLTSPPFTRFLPPSSHFPSLPSLPLVAGPLRP